MTEIKSHEFDGFLQRSARSYRIFLVYGPDRGLVSERATALAKASGINLDDPFATVKLDMNDLQRDHGRLSDEARTTGLFGGNKLVWLRGAGNEKYIADSLSDIAATENDATLIVEAGDLKKGAVLRKIGETTRAVASIACYADDARALNALIDLEMADAGLRITPAARSALVDLIGGDRIASRNEIRKLALYCQSEEVVEEHHVQEIIGDASAISVDDAVDAVISGNQQALLHAMQKITSSKTAIFLVIQACLRIFQLLDVMRTEMDDKNTSSSQVMQTLGRHLHFKRKPLVEQALRAWSAEAIAIETQRLQAAVLQSRRRQTLEESVAFHCLLSTTLQAARKART
ncbi:DNA polymerase III subunit delta [Oryzifoliimicrobium ureilyticus]|uniref:DNA polymerase III subunit delta n=1 Tax=Oryzifoliimicrobium ureilyticus TaxID=3113724 RepID=UPI00307657A9